MRTFEDRYRTALDDPDVRAGLTAFQRGWRESRDAAIAGLETAEGRSFDELRRELATIKDDVLANWERYLDREFPPDDIQRMVRVARTELRERFLASGVGLSGTNALVAEGGSVMLVCNEGNNRMSVALTPVHIVTAGIEKMVPTYADAMKQVRLLGRSATGQPITAYTNFVTGPRPGQRQHILLLDNGRTAMAEDPDVAAALRCIRCGACANVCPPYGVVGEHALGHVYTGAIGLVNTAFHHGIEAAAGPQSLCVSCGACAAVCPTEIPLPMLILEVRSKVVDAGAPAPAGRLTQLGIAALGQRWLFDLGTRAAGVLTTPLRSDGVTRVPRWLAERPGVRERVGWRSPPAFPVRPARDHLRQGKREQDAARAMVRQTIATLEGVDDVVTPASSCLAMLRHEAPHLLRGDLDEAERAQQLAGRTYDLISYLTAGPGRLPAGALDNGDRTPVTVHRFCQSTNTLQRRDAVERFLRDVAGVEVVPLPEAEVCCGFGGSTSIRNPELAAGVLDRKLDCVDRADAAILITDNPGCVLHLRGGVHASGRQVEVLHLAEYLARRLPGAPPPGDANAMRPASGQAPA